MYRHALADMRFANIDIVSSYGTSRLATLGLSSAGSGNNKGRRIDVSWLNEPLAWLWRFGDLKFKFE